MLQNIIIWLFQLLFFTVPLFFATNTDELFEFNKMNLTYLITLALVFIWILQMIFSKKILIKRTPFDIPLALFAASQVISTVLSIHPHTSLFGYYSRFHGGLLSTLAYIALYYVFISTVKKSHLPQLLFSLFSSAFLVSLYGISEHFGHSPSCLLITGSFDVTCWIQDVQSRVFATFGQPNWLAAYVITILPLSIVSAAQSKARILQIFYGITSATLFTVLLFTQSRSGFLGLCVSVVCALVGFGFLYWKKLLTKDSILVTKTSVIVLTACLALALIFGTPYSPSISTLLQNNNAVQTTQEPESEAPVNRLEQGGTDSGEIRKIVWAGAFDVWKRYPLFGSGVETFAYSYYKDRPVAHNLVSEWDFLYNKAHNEYLNFLATTGVVGLGTYLLMQAWFTIYCVRKVIEPRTETKQRALTLALLSGYTSLSVTNFFGFSTVMVGTLFFIFPAIVTVLYTTVYKTTTISSQTHPEDARTYVWLTLACIFAVITLANILQYWHADILFTRAKAYLSAGQYQVGFDLLNKAIQKNPSEGLYYDSLADTYAQVAVQLAAQGEDTAAKEVSEAAISLSNKALELNPAHLNFYKTQVRVYITLASLDPQNLMNAENTAIQALERAPTDAKLQFTLAQILKVQGKTSESIVALEKTIQLKPDYEPAYQTLSETYLEASQPAQAAQTATYILNNFNPNNQRALEIATYSAATTK